MRLSLQLYTLRDALTADVPATLAKVKAIGLEYVELAGLYDKSASDWKEMLDAEGLKVSGAHIGMDQLKGDLDAVIAEAKTLGFQYVILPWVDSSQYEGKWDELGKAMEPIGAKLKEAGLTLAYHNHAFEFEGNGLDTLYASTDPELVKAQLDLAWVSIGGEDPAAYVKKMAGRVPLVHVKDYDPSKDPQWQPAGEGVMKWDEILPVCEGVGVEFGSIELDHYAGDPIEAVAKSYAYFAGKGLK